MRIKRNIILSDIYNFTAGSFFFMPMLLLFHRDELDLGFKEFIIGQAFFAATTVIMEVPSGWISDVWKRKNVAALGALLLIIGCLIFLAADSFAMAVIGQIFFGASISLYSGNNAAFLYDSLLSVGRQKDFQKLEAHRSALIYYSLAISSACGGFLYTINHSLPFIASIVTSFIAIISILIADEPERHKKQSEQNPIKDMLTTVKYALHGHVKIAFIIIFSSVLISSAKLLTWIQHPYYIDLKIPETWFGILIAIGGLLAGVSSHLSHFIGKNFSTNKSLTIFWAITLAIAIIAGIKVTWLGVVVLMIGGSCMTALIRPKVSTFINEHVDSSRRATILSTQGLMTSLFFIPLSTGMGYISDIWDLQAVFIGLGLWLCIAGVFLGLLFVKNNKKSSSE